MNINKVFKEALKPGLLMKKDIQKAFDEIKMKYNLPEFSKFDTDFEIADLEEPDNLLRAIRKKIYAKVDMAVQLLEETLQPDTNLTTLYESRVFDEIGKNKVFEIFRQLMIMRRKLDSLEFINNEKEDAVFIVQATQDWSILKPQIISILSKLENSWSVESDLPDKLVYLG